MVAVAFKMSRPDYGTLHRERDRFKRDQQRAAIETAHIAGEKMYRHTQAKMRAVGLGRLANAVGFTSAKIKKSYDPKYGPYGVMFARGGDESLAGGALEAYTQGVTITPENGDWLAVPTPAAPRLVNVGGKRRRLTPSMWKAAGLDQRIGKLIFRQIRSNLALLVVRKVSLSAKTGQARALGKTKPRTRIIPQKDVVVFVLIRQTRRAKRFDKDEIALIYHNRIPDYLARILRDYQRGYR
ncbi:MAG: hypothetical protein ABW128_06780 [Rhizorhabdus sp.]